MKKELYRQSETVVIKRSQINFASYNPKNHSDQKIAQIKKNIKSVAFLGGIIWNERTSNLIDGHKRIMTLDLIHKYDGTPEKDYDVKVEKIDLDEKTEKEQNIFQIKSITELDFDLLAVMIPDIDYQNAGLDEYDLNLIQLEVPTVDMTSSIKESSKPTEEKRPLTKEEGKAKKEVIKDDIENKYQGDPTLILTFDNFENKAEFMERFRFDIYDKYIKGEDFADMVERID